MFITCFRVGQTTFVSSSLDSLKYLKAFFILFIFSGFLKKPRGFSLKIIADISLNVNNILICLVYFCQILHISNFVDDKHKFRYNNEVANTVPP